MRKINVRSPFYISDEEGIEPVILPDPYFYHTATECGGSTTVSVRSTTELTNGQGIKVNGYGDTCFEVTGTLTETNETDVTFIYDTCDKCNGVPDYNYYTAELCAGGSPINVRSIDTLTVGQVIKAENYSADCYTITGSGSSNTNTVVTLFNSCDHCETGIDYKYYDANSCDGTSSVVVRYEGTLPASLPVVNVSGQGDKCFILDGLTDETSTNDITSFYQSCTSCTPIDPFTYYTATECGGSATVDFKSNITLAIGSSVTLDGYGTTCYQVTSVGSVSGIAWTNKYEDCTACANANDPYNYYYAQKCDGTGGVIKIASTNSLDYMLPRLWKASGQDDTCFSILSQTTSGGTVYNAIATCPECPSDDPFTYWKAIKCSGSTIVYFRSLVDMTGKVIKVSGDDNCYQVTNKVSTPNTKDWEKIFDSCLLCEQENAPDDLKDVNLLTRYENTYLNGKSFNELETEFKCLACVNAVQYDTYKAVDVPMAIGHQLYNENGNKNTTLNGSFVSISTQQTPTASVCNQGQIVFPLIYSFTNGIVTYVKEGKVNDCYKLPTIPEGNTLYCGGSYTQGADTGRKLYTFYSWGIGDLTVTVTGNEVPCRFILKWRGEDQVDTGYIGSNKYDSQLLSAGVDAGDINTSPVSNKNAVMTFNKDDSETYIVELEVLSPLINDEYTIDLTQCPALGLPEFDKQGQLTIEGYLYTPEDSDTGISTLKNITLNANRYIGDDGIRGCLSSLNDSIYRTTTKVGVFNHGEDRFLRFLSPQVGLEYYQVDTIHFFIDGSGLTYQNLLTSLSQKSWEEDIEFFRKRLSVQNLLNNFYIIYVVDPGDNNFARQYHAYLLKLLEKLETEGGATGLKDLIDVGRLKIVYDVQRSQPVTYYRDVMAQQLNDLNVGYNLICG